MKKKQLNETKEKREQKKQELKEKKLKQKRERRSDFLYFKFWPYMYKKYSRKPVNPRLIVFADNRVDKISEDMKLLYDELKKLGYECHFVGREPTLPESAGKIKRLRYAWRYCAAFFKLYGRCRCLYLNDSFKMAFACPPREGTNVIQLWNHCGVLKCFALASKSHNSERHAEVLERRPTHNIYTHIISPAEELNKYYANAFNTTTDKVYALGYPKTDHFLDYRIVRKNREHLIKKVSRMSDTLGSRKIILYAPSVRHNSSGEAYLQRTLDFMLLKRLLGDDYVIIIKLPQTIKMDFDKHGIYRELSKDFLFDVSDKVSMSTALMSADILVSDYSTNFYEFSLLERPMIFYAYDLDRYKGENRFFMDYESFVPGPIVKDTLELIEAVRATEKPDYDDYREVNFRNRYMDACQGDSIEKIIEGTT